MSDVSSTRLKSRQTEDFRDAIDSSAGKEPGDRFLIVSPSVALVASIRCDHRMGGDKYAARTAELVPRKTFSLRMSGASHDFAGAPIRYIDYWSRGV